MKLRYQRKNYYNMQILMVALLIMSLILWMENKFKKYCYRKFEAKVHFPQVRMVEEEAFEYELELINLKLLFLPIIKITLTVPSCFDVADKHSPRYSDIPYSYTVTTSLFSYQRLKRKIKLVGHVRGFYDIDTTITCIDLFGLHRMKYPITLKNRIMIHPKTLMMNVPVKSKEGLQGDEVVQRWIHKDPLFYSGFRNYTTRDSIRDIDWKMSAKSGDLVVRNYDATSDPSIVMFFLGYKDEHYYSEIVEYNISFMASFIQQAFQKQVPISLYTNFATRGKMKGTTPLECNENHVLQLFDLLACITYATGLDAASYLKRYLPKWGRYHTFVIITRHLEEELISLLYHFASVGYQIQVFTHDVEGIRIPQVEVYQLKKEVKPNAE
ncbi:MAG: DUF58 domain-containing protein [Erysipelotrichaceae bacterium]|nr:DUF58 domain-containing protein [Erysipelotrichaceae bacterium]